MRRAIDVPRVVTRAWALAILFPALALAGPQERLDVARAYAPTIVQETRADRYPNDYIAAVNYDGDFDGTNNFENLSRFRDGAGPPAVVYYTVMETATHYFVHYFPYMPIDDKSGNGHEHDTESLLVTVRKLPRGIDVMETRWHNEWKTFAGSPFVLPGTDQQHAGVVAGFVQVDTLAGGNEHPLVMRQRVGHGICGGEVVPGDLLYPQSTATEESRWEGMAADSAQFIVCGGAPIVPYATYVIYRYLDGTAQQPQPGEATQTVGYELREIFSSLWPKRSRDSLLTEPMVYEGSVANGCSPGAMLRSFKGDCPDFCSPAGETCTSLACRGTCDAPGLGCGDDPPSIWGQSSDPGSPTGTTVLPRPPIGEQFFDPAGVMARRLTIPGPYTLAYIHNPYVGVSNGVVSCP
jgi:hypothetical protein